MSSGEGRWVAKLGKDAGEVAKVGKDASEAVSQVVSHVADGRSGEGLCRPRRAGVSRVVGTLPPAPCTAQGRGQLRPRLSAGRACLVLYSRVLAQFIAAPHQTYAGTQLVRVPRCPARARVGRAWRRLRAHSGRRA